MTQVSFRPMQGYAFGAIQSSAVVVFDPLGKQTSGPDSVIPQLVESLPLPPLSEAIDLSLTDGISDAKATLIVRITDHLNALCGDQRFTRITATEVKGNLVFYVPTLAPLLVADNVKATIRLLAKRTEALTHADFDEFLQERLQETAKYLPTGTNTKSFLATAAKYRLPFRLFAVQNVIYGYGSGSAIFNSSISHKESQIGASLASNKAQAHAFLSTLGVPVAEQAIVPRLDIALTAAAQLGYPVVLKPMSEEQGRGVIVDIRNDDELTTAYETSRERYDKLILEKQVKGELYRINTLNGSFIRAVKRVPARVVGDGQSTLDELIEDFNRDLLGNDPDTFTQPIAIDEELKSHLAKYALDLNTVPESGQTIQLTPIWKSSRGGHSEDFMDRLHPENIKLCEKIARSLRLHVTGIDLLSPDASLPWYENDAVICEVNARPQLGITHLDVYRKILAQSVGDPPPVHLKISQNGTTETICLFDPAEERIDLTLKALDVIRNGCPTQYFTTLEIAQDVPRNTRKMLEQMLFSVEPKPLDATA